MMDYDSRPDHEAEPAPDPPRQPAGLSCPRCGCGHLPVYYTRRRQRQIVRVRFCRHCGRRMTTRERLG